MRNIYDQYSQQENKLTHALVSTLHHDRKLLRPFLQWLGAKDIPNLKDLFITEQQVPGTETFDDGEEKGLPDAWVYDDEGWSVIIESKVQAKISIGQLIRHRKTAKRFGFEEPLLILIAVDQVKGKLPANTSAVQWRDVYSWFRKKAPTSTWAKLFLDYMHVFESKMLADDYNIRGTITMFDGICFDKDNPYTYREGKRLIRLLGDELQQRNNLHKIGVDPKGKRRNAITGRGGDRVWDFLPLKIARKANSFTDFPHLTLDLGQSHSSAAITVPHRIKGGFKSRLKEEGIEGFCDLILKIEKSLRPVLRRSKNSKPVAYVLQRHYLSQRSQAEQDARLTADLRTLIRSKGSNVRYQPQWMEAIYNLLANKRSNMQFGVSVQFQYGCPVLNSKAAVDLFAGSWIAMKPLIDFALGK